MMYLGIDYVQNLKSVFSKKNNMCKVACHQISARIRAGRASLSMSDNVEVPAS